MNQFNYCHTKRRIDSNNHYNSSNETKKNYDDQTAKGKRIKHRSHIRSI